MLFPPLTLVRKTMASYYSPGHDWTGRKDCRDIIHSCSTLVDLSKRPSVRNNVGISWAGLFFNALHLSNVCFHDKNVLALLPLVTYHYKSSRFGRLIDYFWVGWVWTCRVTVRHCSKMFPKHGWPSKVRSLRITPVIFRNTFCFLIARLATMLR